jgi:hypothetical protein
MIDIRLGRCPLCDHPEIIEAVAAEFAHAGVEVPAAVTYDARLVQRGRNPGYPYGLLKLYVCRACGYCQYFADDPSSIPIGEEHQTRVIAGRARDPYR